jgi:hypothetical protein
LDLLILKVGTFKHISDPPRVDHLLGRRGPGQEKRRTERGDRVLRYKVKSFVGKECLLVLISQDIDRES